MALAVGEEDDRQAGSGDRAETLPPGHGPHRAPADHRTDRRNGAGAGAKVSAAYVDVRWLMVCVPLRYAFDVPSVRL